MTATSSARWLGAVLAGGRSRRFGSDKGQAQVGGARMIDRAIDALSGTTEAVVVVSSRAVDYTAEVPRLPDRIPGKGPLGGLHAALCHAEEQGLDGVLLLACDLPLVDAATIDAILSNDDGRPIVAPARDGGVEPLAALYRNEILPVVEELLATDELSLHALFDRAAGTRLDLGGTVPADAFLNVNTPEERMRAEAASTPEGRS